MGHDQKPTPARPSAPTPAREGTPPTPPTPVRAFLGDAGGDTPAVEPLASEASLEVDGVPWTVTVAGKSRSGAAEGPAPILLLRFEVPAGAEAEPREAWAVGRALGELTERQLERAFRTSRPAPTAWNRKPLFPEAGSRSGKDG
jgi:hypothetical protein